MIWRLDEVKPDAPIYVGCDLVDHDEDADDVVDGCDKCPGIADDQADADGDGVGDACDPNGSSAHNLALFLPFAGESVWTPVAGTWIPEADSLVYKSATATTSGITVRDGMMPEPPFVLEARITLDSLSTYGALQFLVDSDATGLGATCGVIRRDSPPTDYVHAAAPGGTNGGETKLVAPLTSRGYRVRFTYDRTSMRCMIMPDDQVAGDNANSTTFSSPAPGALGLRALHLGVALHYVAIYKER